MLVLLALGVAPTDRDVDYKSLFTTMTAHIDAANGPLPSADSVYRVGYSKVNLTPAEPLTVAGYSKRMGKHYTSVHDSIYVRTLVIDNGTRRVAVVSADLLIIPPTVTALLEQQLPEIHFTLENTYLGATHSHNSIGNWGKGFTSFMLGMYEDSVVRFITDKIKQSIVEASQNMLPAKLSTTVVAMPEGVYNRVTDGGPVDPLLRCIKIERTDGSRLLFVSYTAHATCLFSRDLELSGDYPGKLTEMLEADDYDFAMFMAGAVGSHGPAAPKGGWDCIDWMATNIIEKLEAPILVWAPMQDTGIEMHRISLALSEPQPKISPSWRMRPWLFRAAFGEYPTFISTLRIGDVVFLSTPCDFSGEFNFSIDSLAASRNVFPVVTSFNGGYIGYVTPEKYYDEDHHETQLMNWYGPGNGEYLKDVLEYLLISVTE